MGGISNHFDAGEGSIATSPARAIFTLAHFFLGIYHVFYFMSASYKNYRLALCSNTYDNYTFLSQNKKES